MELIFLGTGAGNGVPVFYCECTVCKEANIDPKYRRTRSAIAVKGSTNIVVDAPPEISAQLLRENITSVDCLFLTHSHHDHTAGLGDLAIYARYYRGEKLPAFMSKKTLNDLESSHGRVQDWMDVTLLEVGQSIEVDGLVVSAVNAAHSPGTLGYILETQGVRTAYIPDTGPLPAESTIRLQGVDRLILDATFSGDNFFPKEHQSIATAIEEAKKIDVGQLYLTHLSLHYSKPITSAEIERLVQQYSGKVKLAYDGTRFDLGQKPLVEYGWSTDKSTVEA